MSDDRPSLVPWLAGALVLAAPSTTRADAFVSAPGTRVDERAITVLLMHDGRKETLVQQIDVISTARESVWLVALPSRPISVRPAEPTLIDNLDALTEVPEPYNEAVRRTLFGPSVVTLLTKKLMDPPPPRREPESEDPPRRLELTETAFFDGAVVTSTITMRPSLPPGLAAILQRSGRIDIPFETSIASYLNRGWVIAALSLSDTRPSEDRTATIGPLVFELVSPQPVVPLGLADLEVTTPLRIHIASTLPLAPIAMEAFWDVRPWAKDERPSNVFHVTFNRPIPEEDPIDFELRQRSGLTLPANMRLLRGQLSLAPGPRVDVDLTESTEGVTLPAPAGRGSAQDLLICALLGLTPLLYTPESWFLLWLGGRARSRARREGRPGIRLWSGYALAVGFFWFVVLPGGARVAAIIPALVGIVQLALPYVEREPLPVRAQFKKKKPAAKS